MAEATTIKPVQSSGGLGTFERYLSVWVALCMVAGIGLGKLLPGAIAGLRGIEFGKGSQINAPIAVLIWLMITPMMMKVDFSSVKNVGRRPAGLARDAVHQLGGQALLDGAPGMGLLPDRLCRLHHSRRSRPVHCRLHHSGRCALHGDGVCLEPSDERGRGLYARAGVGE